MAFKIQPSKCQTCGKTLRGTVEQIVGCAGLFEIEGQPGEFEYVGGTEVWWDEGGPQRERPDDPQDEGRYRVMCPSGHEWWATLVDVEEEKERTERFGQAMNAGEIRP